MGDYSWLDEKFPTQAVVRSPRQTETKPEQDWWFAEKFGGPTLVQNAAPQPGAQQPPGTMRLSDQRTNNDIVRKVEAEADRLARESKRLPQQPGLVPVDPIPHYRGNAENSDEQDNKRLAEPDAATWLGRRAQDIKGRHDPRYTHLPSVHETGMIPVSDDAQFKLTGSGDKAYADFLSAQLGDRQTRRFKDANDHEIIGFRRPDTDKEQLAYVNKPGWEWNDIDRGVTGALPFMAAGGAAGMALGKAPLAWQIAGQGVAGAATSAAQDAAASEMGSQQGFDAMKSVGATVGGAAGAAIGPALGWAIAKFVREPGLIDATGKLTAAGLDAARKAGLDPADLTEGIAKTFATQFARSGDAKAAGIAAELGDVGIPTTVGQRSKNVRQLMDEQAIRDGTWGTGASNEMKAFDERQWNAMRNATMGDVAPGKPGMSLQLAPHRSPADYEPGKIGTDIGDRLQMALKAAHEGEAEAWKKVGKLQPTDDAKAVLWDYVNAQLGSSRPITEKLHPVASGMVRQIEDFIEGKAPEQISKFLKSDPMNDINVLRKQLSKAYRDLPKSEDREHSGQLYTAFNTWTREMAEQKLLVAEGVEPAVAAANMAVARGLSADLHALFEVKGNSAGGAIMKQILERADNPEEIIRQLFVGPSSSVVKPGSIAALNAIKQISAKHLPPEEASALMGDLKLAYFLRMVRNPSASTEEGKMFNPQRLMTNLRNSLDAHRSVWQTLYTPQEQAFARRIVKGLENGPTFHDWTVKPNSSRSGTMGANLIQDFLGVLMGKSYGKVALTAAKQYTGIGRAAANKATDQVGSYAVPSLAPMAGAAGFSAGMKSD